MPRLILAPRARRWLHAELAYLANVSPAAVGRLRERVATARRLLSEYPRIGSQARARETRRLVVLPYVLIYREKDGGVEIIDIRHSRQAERAVPDET